MATLRQYFDTDFSRVLAAHQIWQARSTESAISVIARVHLDFDANAKYASCFVPACVNPGAMCRALIDEIEGILKVDSGVMVEVGRQDLNERTASHDLRFTGRIFIYSETGLGPAESSELTKMATERGLALCIREPEYAIARARIEKPMAFISHDSRDKDAVARPVAIGLIKLICPVWFDEFSLKVGDSLRESIERGLTECKKCILVLSPRFLSNPGWT
jgi:hypothetical protein